ncbi:MAG: ligase-associated DNA damage response endonuclease PdeM [Leptolyngbyaceae cyanobacterium SL_7_1]|nr:ligase-associated DNA damage response endonuclease PdeM [Leptolyngbyaceae cyanobacterium SL_7_1]
MGWQMKQVTIAGMTLQLLPEKAVYIESLEILLVSDIHLGKSETFQSLGIPIANQINQVTIDRLHYLCTALTPKMLIILGDLFHSNDGLVEEVVTQWTRFVDSISTTITVKLIVGNHDRQLIQSLHHLGVEWGTEALQIHQLVLSHYPEPQPRGLNICGHIHPCIRIKTRLDNLRLPCFFWIILLVY